VNPAALAAVANPSANAALKTIDLMFLSRLLTPRCEIRWRPNKMTAAMNGN
jgi:hypothetical protein